MTTSGLGIFQHEVLKWFVCARHRIEDGIFGISKSCRVQKLNKTSGKILVSAFQVLSALVLWLVSGSGLLLESVACPARGGGGYFLTFPSCIHLPPFTPSLPLHKVLCPMLTYLLLWLSVLFAFFFINPKQDGVPALQIKNGLTFI